MIRMRMTLIGLAILLSFSPAYTKDKTHYIDLGPDVFRIDSLKFYVEEVIDERDDQSTIGTVQKGLFNSLRDAQMVGSVEAEFLRFISHSLRKSKSLQPVILRINYFKIAEQTSIQTEVGISELKVEFTMRDASGKSIRLFEANASISDTALDVTKGHARRIRKAIVDCLKQFSESKLMNNFTPQIMTKKGTEFNKVKLQTVQIKSKKDKKVVEQIEISHSKPRYRYRNLAHKDLLDLEHIILIHADDKILKKLSKLRSAHRAAAVADVIGGAGVGYSVGYFLVSRQIYWGALLLGGTSFLVGALIKNGIYNMSVDIVRMHNMRIAVINREKD